MVDTKLVEQYIPLANKLASQKKKTLPRFIDFEDLRSAAYLGLVEAANRFNPNIGICFSTFAYSRINGAMIDYLRNQGWLKRGSACFIVSLDSKTSDDSCNFGDTIEAKKEVKNQDEILETILFKLEDQAKSVLKHYFIDQLSMKEVGQKIGVTEGRVSQLIKKYKDQIRSNWSEVDFKEELAA